MHKYLHHIGDFLADTSNLNDHQLATYLRMIWAYYKTELPLPNDCEGIAFAMRSDETTVRLLLKNYFKLQGECWHQKRVAEEISAYRAKSESGKKSANARWNNANALPTQNERNANEPVFDANHKAVKPVTLNTTKTKTNTRAVGAGVARPDDVSESVWADFLDVRKKRRAPLTATALAGICKQATIAGITVQAALEVACARGWQSFNAEWLGSSRVGGNGPAKRSNAVQPSEPGTYGDNDELPELLR